MRNETHLKWKEMDITQKFNLIIGLLNFIAGIVVVFIATTNINYYQYGYVGLLAFILGIELIK